jgi:hypothetical protein
MRIERILLLGVVISCGAGARVYGQDCSVPPGCSCEASCQGMLAPRVTVQILADPACCRPNTQQKPWWCHCQEPPRAPVVDSVALRRDFVQLANAALTVLPQVLGGATPTGGAPPSCNGATGGAAPAGAVTRGELDRLELSMTKALAAQNLTLEIQNKTLLEHNKQLTDKLELQRQAIENLNTAINKIPVETKGKQTGS